ncbi:acetyltransferase : GCN5-related N-acetyltransferase OS=Clostridium cellulovorans (strain ATCC 35296 / DSM 3052 / OCM 3 / 743B) GN=Clocel_3826 PE=4 SV=1: Acetyltransf_3 [Tuwongella immobilis]|uniref:N-acetyltransferase domain-containing protein n=2 Tax=Tuwongella immobilis TaxID=692036 RepID=A0A6C2YTS6_9BACT|nr:acetyltransferase : GCN5-related N-acetyltransferase OS=Clostridium cellulovorans (strain ATCC 35296 / DSM 3052 / OCM 3 / 743B) GN=Clocel_3826 PE=4 SV=1: Acetyltransf_3 [Tuwongella immobilis]VTS06873.1 acetyltransferase : GCN5-related N-acetyltransferase OS=Clostridium cellulovorans (strain ATCC 35296 / DSM 3052 / OCM 3 / 743B) GN=Clocel_3826 PE=4 SV=1: Acetyltransf_3 [Tuwongella immobilis]
MVEQVSGGLLDPPRIDIGGAYLRPLRLDDVDAIHAYLRDPRVTELTSFPVVSLALAEAIINRSLTRWAAGEPSRWGIALPHDDQIVGTCGFVDWSRDHRWADLAYDLSVAQWGQGLMKRAITAALRWAFQCHQIDRVQAFVRVDNERSARLLERCGFTREGCLRDYRVCRGRRYDFSIYGLLRSDAKATESLAPEIGHIIPPGRNT